MKTIKDGLFIVFEGINGAGKTTTAKALQALYSRLGYECIYLREPGSNETCEKIRDITKSTQLSDQIRTLLFTSSMSINYHESILPALKSGKIVIMDRYMRSNFILQHFASQYYNEDQSDFESRQSFFCDLYRYEGLLGASSNTETSRVPDIEFILDLPAALAWARTNKMPTPKDAMEVEGFEYFIRQCNEFGSKSKYILDHMMDVCAQYGGRKHEVVHINAIQSTNKVIDECVSAIKSHTGISI